MTPGRFATPLLTSLGLALAIRLVIAVAFPNYYAPDEVFQYLEQAHRLVYGQGYVPWEFQVGLRSWLIPLLLAAPMALAHWVTPAPQAGLMLIRILLCLASLPIVWCATKWGERFHGSRGAWAAGLLTAIWPDLWLMAPHPLEEALSTDLLVPAIYLVEASRGCATLRHVSLAGFLLGLTFALREQLAPAVAIAGIYLCGRDARRWVLAVAAAAIPVLGAGLLDWFTWGGMFRSFWMNIYLNIGLGVSSHYFESSSPAYYVLNLLYDWGLGGCVFIAYFAWRGARKLPVAGLAAVATIALHCCIAHKELRFIFPAMALLVALAGVGLAGLRGNTTVWHKVLLAAAVLNGPFASPMLYMMVPWQDSAFRLYSELAARHPCVVSIQTWNRGFWAILPVFDGKTRFTGETINGAGGDVEADAIVAAANTQGIPPGFTRQSCARESWVPFQKTKPDVCFWTRKVASCPAGPVAPFVLVYPPAAKAFVIRDRLTDGW
jgi:GPI mannosyltransferase 3